MFRLGAVAAVLALLAALAFSLERCGRNAERAATAAREAQADIAAGAANLAAQKQVTAAVDRFGSERARLSEEMHRARTQLDTAAQAAPEPGRVGADALVDARLAHDLVCGIERLRQQALAACPDTADAEHPDRSDREPVPARPPA